MAAELKDFRGKVTAETDAAYAMLASATDPDLRLSINAELCRLVKRRSAAQVERMERERGLRP